MFSIIKKIKKMIGNVKDNLLKIQEKFLRGISSFMKKLRKRKIRKFSMMPKVVNSDAKNDVKTNNSICEYCDQIKYYTDAIEKIFVEVALHTFSINKFAKRLFKDSELESKGRALKSSIQKLESYLNKNQVEIKDYNIGQDYNEGMNVDVINEIKLEEDRPYKKIIDDILSPTITIKGQENPVKIAKVILRQVAEDIPSEKEQISDNQNEQKIDKNLMEDKDNE